MKKVKLNPFYISDYLTKGKIYDVLKEDEENGYLLLDDDGDKVYFKKCKFNVVGEDAYDDLNNEIGLLKDKIAYLEECISHLRYGVSALSNRLIDRTNERDWLKKESNKLKEEINKLKLSILELKQLNNEMF